MAIVDAHLTVSNYSMEILILPIERKDEYFFFLEVHVYRLYLVNKKGIAFTLSSKTAQKT